MKRKEKRKPKEDKMASEEKHAIKCMCEAHKMMIVIQPRQYQKIQ